MQDKGVSVAALLAALVAFPALANSLSGAWETELSLLPALGLASTLALDYTWDGLVLGSTSQLLPTGFIWQSFSLAGGWKTLSLKADLLLGPSTADYLYGQLILTREVRRLELRLYAAQLSDAVLGGPALGSALRLAGAAGEVQFVGILELGARIEDEDFHGIIIYHTTSGLWRHYATNPMTSGAGFTGAKLTLSGLRLCCLEGTEATLYFTKAGFDYLRFALSGINLGPFPGLRLDLEVEFQVQTKSLAFTPRVEREEVGCLELYFQVETGPSPGGVAGISLYGLGWECELGPVRGRGLTVLDTGRYVITTEAYGSEIESLTDVAENGHEFYPNYWELLSLSVEGSGCCGDYLLLVNIYFQRGTGKLFGWGMTRLELSLPLSPALETSGVLSLSPDGVERLSFCFTLAW
jgi:hypothetical protein